MEEKEIDKEEKKLSEIEKYFVYFFVYSFLGWVMETIYCVVTLGQFQKRGFLYGPICPIYGFGAVILIYLSNRIKTNFVGKFAISFLAFTAIEYIASVLLESLFGLRWWDYSNNVLNFQGRISLAFSIAWGILGVIFVQNIHPYVSRKLNNIVEKISANKIKIVIKIFVSIVILDEILSIIKYLV